MSKIRGALPTESLVSRDSGSEFRVTLEVKNSIPPTLNDRI